MVGMVFQNSGNAIFSVYRKIPISSSGGEKASPSTNGLRGIFHLLTVQKGAENLVQFSGGKDNVIQFFITQKTSLGNVYS